MARLPRLCMAGIPQHIIQRGNNRQICFGSEADFSAYAYWLEDSSQKYKVSIHAWVFMTNHVHLLVTSETGDGISRMMQTLGRHYVRYFNHTYRRTGTLWEGRFKSSVIDEENYLLICQRYIELNPVRAGMVESPGDYVWSSYQANGLGKQVKVWTPHKNYQQLGETFEARTMAYRELFLAHFDQKLLKEIRTSVNKGMALGNDRFKQDVDRLAGRRVTPLKPGPKLKSV